MAAFKGYCKIETRDTKTGKIETVEDHNLVTKALTYFYDQGGLTNPTAFNVSALRTDALRQLLGGVLCLDTVLNASDEIIRVPAGVSMTANGARDVLNSSNPNELGSWNENESGWQQDGSYKMVFDWNTSQGNGVINCVCLTSLLGGKMGWGNPGAEYTQYNESIGAYNSLYSKTTPSGHAAIGLKDNIITMIPARVEGATTLTVKKLKFPFTEIDIRDTPAQQLEEEKTVTLPAAVQNLSGVWAVQNVYFKNNTATILIGQLANQSYPSLYHTFYVLTYNLTNDTFTGATQIIAPGSGNEYIQCTGISDAWAILGSYAIELANTTNVIELTDAAEIIHTAFGSWFARLSAVDSQVFVGAMSGSNIGIKIDVDREVVEPTNNYNNDYVIIGEPAPLLALRQDGAAIMRDPRYLATIFNLEAPITKTADKTMKVTYVIRFTSN